MYITWNTFNFKQSAILYCLKKANPPKMKHMLFSKSLTLLLSLSGCGACIVPILIFWLNNRFKTIAPIIYTFSLLELNLLSTLSFFPGFPSPIHCLGVRLDPARFVSPSVHSMGKRVWEKEWNIFFSVFFFFWWFFCPTFKLASRQAVMQSKRSCPSPLSLTKERERERGGGRK